MNALAEPQPLPPAPRFRLAGPWDASPAEAAAWESARGGLPTVVAVVQLLLTASTASLWLLPWRFPAVPLLHAAVELPPAADVFCSLLLLAGWIGVAACPEGGLRRRGALLLVVACFPLAAVLNQHRLQPWAWHGWLFAVAWLGTPVRERSGWLRLLTVSIYFYSALSKFDHAFLHDLGPILGTAAGGALGLPSAWLEATAGPRTAWLAPAGELLVAVWLASGFARGPATISAVAMHLLLLAALGPWGLGHSLGVLGWNLLFIAWDLYLFWPVPDRPGDSSGTSPEAPESPAYGFGAWPARIVLGAAMLLPLAEPWGGFDLWLSWGLYAPKNERCELWVAPDSIPMLPAWARVEVDAAPPPPEFPADWKRIRLDRGSLRVVGAPLYPQNRFQLGAALGAALEAAPNDFGVVLRGPSPRWGGPRSRETLRGRSTLDAAARTQFYGNALPRPWSGG